MVDEYDKPILDALGTPEVARANRSFLRGLYSVIKSCDAHIKFTLLTGVSKFSRAFSRGARGGTPRMNPEPSAGEREGGPLA